MQLLLLTMVLQAKAAHRQVLQAQGGMASVTELMRMRLSC